MEQFQCVGLCRALQRWRDVRRSAQSVPSRSAFRVLYVIMGYISGGICATHAGAPSSVSRLLGNVSQISWSSSRKPWWRLQLYLWAPGNPENQPAWPLPPQGKGGYRHFLQSSFFWWHLELQRRQWEVEWGQIPGDRYWQPCTAIPEKLKQLRERWLSLLSFWAICHFLKVMEASCLLLGFIRRLE